MVKKSNEKVTGKVPDSLISSNPKQKEKDKVKNSKKTDNDIKTQSTQGKTNTNSKSLVEEKSKSVKLEDKTKIKAPHKVTAPQKNKNDSQDNAFVATGKKKPSQSNSVSREIPDIDVDLSEIYQKKLEYVQNHLKMNKTQVEKAVDVFKNIVDEKFNNSIDLLARKEDEFVHLNLVFSKLPYRYTIRPIPIELNSGFYSKEFNTRVCLIVKDPLDDFEELGIKFGFFVKVLDIKSLKLKFDRFNERRDLLKEFDLFICDSRVYMLLKRFLGKPFYKAKKYPISLNLDYTQPEKIKEDITDLVEKKVLFYMTHGPNYSVKVGRITMNKNDLVKNILAVSNSLVPHVLKWGVDFKE